MEVNYEHLLAIGLIGVAGIMGVYMGHIEAGYTLLGGLLGYAFKNGKVLINK